MIPNFQMRINALYNKINFDPHVTIIYLTNKMLYNYIARFSI